jgi:hypothetical protein
MSSVRVWGWPTFFAGLLTVGGCLPDADTGSATTVAESSLLTLNGLQMINGLTMTNGLQMINGLTMTNGLSGQGLESNSDFVNSEDGRMTIAYMVRCALPANHSITKQDQDGVSYTFPGQIGVAPEWENGECSTGCQQHVTACLLAHVNTTGVHIPLWLDGDSEAIGWSLDSDFPYEEGSFFGNIFVSPPVAYYCNGKDFDVGVVPGRLGAGQGDAPYTNPVKSPGGYCRDTCTPTDIPYQDDGYKACLGYNHVVTVWRNPDASTITTGAGGSTGSGTGGSTGSGTGSTSTTITVTRHHR